MEDDHDQSLACAAKFHNDRISMALRFPNLAWAFDGAALPFPWWIPTLLQTRIPTPDELANRNTLSDGITIAIDTGTEEAPEYKYHSFTWRDVDNKTHTVTLGEIELALVLLHNWVNHAWLCFRHLPKDPHQCLHYSCKRLRKRLIKLLVCAGDILAYRRSIYSEGLDIQDMTNSRRVCNALPQLNQVLL